ncbi:syndecan-4-like isoform X2 [Seriola lalandi dorsalis]|uniref:Syndecan n=1 Tax=Seriola lalandi dorsalis TaxID=1841481 RepID=A0A3B4XS57_SERLL|nr:syndecan-4-like isoform X2 [Seriola lalandi dorsalis]XP_056255280.1 syndecan-4 isoform X2 [Seriola aureovittata]
MLNLCLVLILSASVFSESVRETETWMPMKTTQMVAMSTHRDNMESSGDSTNGSDFGFTDDDEDDDNEYYEYDDEELSGSGDGATTESPETEFETSVKPDVSDNKIPELELPVRPTVDEEGIVRESNEIPRLGNEADPNEEYPSNVLMSHASEDSILNKTEVLAALIAGGAVCLMFAVLLILLLIYRMKKKDEGSYDLGKKPIYKKAPTTEIYA